MPKAKLMLIACDDEADALRVRDFIQQLSDRHISAGGVDVAVDWRELDLPYAQFAPQFFEPMFATLKHHYPPAKP